MADIAIALLRECARWSLRLPSALSAKTAELAGFRIAMEINRASRDGDRLSARLGPDEWLLCAPASFASAVEQDVAAALAGESHSLVDVGHRYAALSVEGSHAAALLAAGCPLDLHAGTFVEGSATRTLLGKVEIILWRVHAAPAYRLDCARSFARYVHDFLCEAAREYA